MKRFFFTLLAIILVQIVNGQNIAITDDDGYTAHPSAMLDVKSTSKGMLVPRLTTSQRLAVSNPETGLLVFDTDAGDFYYYSITGWTNLTSGNTIGIWSKTAGNIYSTDPTDHVGIGTNAPFGKLEVKGDVAVDSEEPLFEVINSNGDTVFAVYSQGVQVRVADDPLIKSGGSKGGFAVGGFSLSKTLTNDYLRVTPDSVRIYVEEGAGTKAGASKGGFAVGGFSLSKGSITNEYLRVTDDSTRIYTGDTIAGFGVSNIGVAQNSSYMRLTPKNYFIGHKAGNDITTGRYNSFMGYESGANQTTGSNNTYLGYQTAYQDTGGLNNVYIGHQAGYSNDGGHFGAYNMGSHNTFLGYQAGYSNNQGAANTFIGNLAGYSNTGVYDPIYETLSGSHNVFVGDYAGWKNTTGMSNVFIGDRAGWKNITGGFNIFLGMYSAYKHTSGDDNIFIGYGAGFDDVTGEDNVYIGKNAGENNNGSGNIFIGRSAGSPETAVSNKFYLDNNSNSESGAFMYGQLYPYVAGGRYLRLNEKVGINISPNYLLDVAGVANLNSGVSSGVALRVNGYEAIWFNGTYFSWGYGGNDNYFADMVGLGVTNPLMRLHVKQSTANRGIRIENSTNTNYWDIGVGSSTNNFKFYYNGGARADIDDVTGAYNQLSDKRKKKNIEPIGSVLEKVLLLAPSRFNFKTEGNNNPKAYGFIAQEVEEIFPDMIKTFESDEEDITYKGLTYDDFSVLAIQAIIDLNKKLENQVDELTIQNKALQEKTRNNEESYNDLKAEVETLKALMNAGVNKE